MKRMQIGVIAIVLTMLFGGAAASVCCPKREVSDRENRELTAKPVSSLSAFLDGSYQTQYEQYLSDQFFCREQWVSLASGLQALTGKRDVNGVYIGKDGYLLEKQDESAFDEEQIEENVQILSGFLNMAGTKLGSSHVSALLVPLKAVAMPQKLPAYAEVNAHEYVIQALSEQLTAKDMLLDATACLKAHQKEPIYYRTDHHWTTLGAYYAYAAWEEQQGQMAPDSDTYQRETIFTDFYGTTYNKAYIRVPADDVQIWIPENKPTLSVQFDDQKKQYDTLYFKKKAQQTFNRYNLFLGGNTFQTVVDTNAQTGRTLLLIKDSFANSFVPFLTGEYDRIILLDYRYGKTPVTEIFEEHKEITDVLVLFQTEQFMQNSALKSLTWETEQKRSTMEEFDADEFLQ